MTDIQSWNAYTYTIYVIDIQSCQQQLYLGFLEVFTNNLSSFIFETLVAFVRVGEDTRQKMIGGLRGQKYIHRKRLKE